MNDFPWWVWLIVALIVIGIVIALLRSRKREPIITTRSKPTDPNITTRR